MTRKSLMRVGAAAVIGLVVAGCSSGTDDPAPGNTAGGDTGDSAETEDAPSGELTPITWMSPRGSIDVMDDYQIQVAIEMGYFEDQGLDVTLEAGPTEATASTKFVAEGEADISGPSPGVIASSIDTGVPVKAIYNLVSGQIFNFAAAPDSDISSFADLEGKKISVASPAWKLIIDPMLIEAGVDIDSVEYVEAGAQWGQAVALGQADAALGWEGMRAQWAGQGLDVKWILGKDVSVQPSNSYVVAAADLESEEGRDQWTRFLKGVVMGEEFARANPRAAAQITYNRLPALAGTLEPQAALDSMAEIQGMYSLSKEAGDGWGWHNPEGWSTYLEIAEQIGQTSRVLSNDEVFTNDLLEEANNVDVAAAQADAEAYELDDDFANLTLP